MKKDQELQERLDKAEALVGSATEIIQRQVRESEFLEEGMRELQLALENKGWKSLSGASSLKEFDGLDLDLIKKISDELRAHLTGGALAKRLVELRASFVIGAGGVEYDGIDNVKRALNDDKNQEVLFGTNGIAELIRAEATDGNIGILVNKRTKKIRRLPIHRFDALYVNPDDPEDVWFVKERYNRVTVEKPEGEEVVRWYRTDLCDDPDAKKMKTITEPGEKPVEISSDWVIVIDSVNGQIGHILGTPDLLSSVVWVERYNTFLQTQLQFAQALSAIAVQIKSRGSKAQEQARSAVSVGGQAGMSVTSDDTEIVAQRGGSDVSFDNGRALAAMAATGAEVSVIHALSDPGASGSSYGSAQTLDLPTSRAVQTRREHVGVLLQRVLKVMGAKAPTVRFPQLADEMTHRLVQALSVLWSTGLFAPEELRSKFGELVDLSITGNAPAGVMIPNNEKTLKTEASIKASASSASDNVGSDGTSAGFVNGQGRDALGIGKTDDQSNGNRPIRDDEQ